MSLTKIVKILDAVTGSDTRRSKNGTTFKPATKAGDYSEAWATGCNRSRAKA